MFTQCPHCNTIFQPSANQLKAANGNVRCGHCLSVFNALDHLSEDVPSTRKAEGADDLAYEASEYHQQPGKMPDRMTNTDEPVAKPTGTGLSNTTTDSSDVFNDIISEVSGRDVPMEEIDHFETFLATDTLPAEDFSTTAVEGSSATPIGDSPATNDSFPVNHSRPADHSLLAGDSAPAATINTDVADTLSPGQTSASADETNFGDIDTVTAALDADISIADDEFAEFDAYLDNTEDEARHINKTDVDDNEIITEAADLQPITPSACADTAEAVVKQRSDTANTAVSEKDPQANTVHTAEEPSSPANETQTVNIPRLILDDLHAAKAEQLRPSSTPWLIGSLMLMFTLVLQVVYHSRDELARDANLRPWLIQMCEMLNCTLSQPYDIKQINIIGQDVRSHPSADKALVVSTTLINNATFVQPFPLLTMVFSDINGATIAQRRFTPREYLGNTIDLTTGMTPDMPVRIDLELIDPGTAAVNYEFHAEIDPRRTRPLT